MKRPLVVIPSTWDMCYIPSERTLYRILLDVVEHGVEFPTHGTNCACMDSFSYEIRRHVDRVLPQGNAFVSHEGEWEKSFDARSRIRHVLGMVARSL